MSSQSAPMSGKTVMVTGATSGIGTATARALAAQGATIVLVGRSREKSAAVAEQIRRATGSATVDFLLADLTSHQAIRRLAGEFRERYERLHVLVNNAGGLFMSRQLSVDGIEMTLALNHLSYFLLTSLLLDTLKASAPARVVSVSSHLHRDARIDFDNLQLQRGYSGFRAYGLSKLANILFTFELARQLEGSGVSANTLHPGIVKTNFGSNNGLFGRLMRLGMNFTSISPEEGAQTSVYLASSPEVEDVTGAYFEKCTSVRAAEQAYDRADAARLWQVSEQLTGIAPD